MLRSILVACGISCLPDEERQPFGIRQWFLFPRVLIASSEIQCILAIVSILLGEALFFQSTLLAWMAFGFAVGFHLFVVFYEERALKQRFGASYERYCSQVSRWLPRLPER